LKEIVCLLIINKINKALQFKFKLHNTQHIKSYLVKL